MTQKERKKVRKPTDKQLFFVWKAITDLLDIHANQLENGAKDNGYHKNGKRAQEIIQQQRLYNSLSK